MKKIMAILVLVAMTVLIIGCVAPEDTNAPGDSNTPDDFTVNNAAEASDATNDIGTDLGGIADSLDEIDDTLTE